MDGGALTAAHVLHARRYGDTSLLLELFCAPLGRVACVAKGALAARRSSVRLQPFQPLLVVLRGRGDVQTLARAEPGGVAPPLQGRRMYCGLYVNELVLRMTARGDPLPGLYARYEQTLHLLGDDAPMEPVLRRFEVALLEELGHGLVLDVDSEGQPITAGARYDYRVDSGPVKTAGAPDQGYSGAVLQALRLGEFDSANIQREARVFMRQVLDHYLDGRPIRSRELFR